MPVAPIGSALSGNNTTTSFSITLPPTEAGDIVVLEFTHRGTADGTIGGTFTETLTKKHEQLYASSAFSGQTYWARCVGDHDGETISVTGLTNSCAGIVTIYRGALATGDPLAAATIVGEANASGNETQAQITTTVDGAYVVLVVANSPDVAVTSPACTSPGALNIEAEKLNAGGTDTSICHASAEKATAGATGAFTWAQTNGASGSWAYAIEPEPEAPEAFELEAEPGSYAVTGAAAGLVAGIVMAAEVGAYAVAGAAAGFALEQNNAPGSYAVTGAAAEFAAAYVENAAPGSYALTGAAATFAIEATAAPGVYVLTGFEAELEFGALLGAFDINAEAGAYALTGAAAGLVAGYVLDAQPGSFSLTGFLAGLVAGYVVEAAPGVYVLTGAEAELLYEGPAGAYDLDAEPGVYVVTGFADGAMITEPVRGTATYTVGPGGRVRVIRVRVGGRHRDV